MADFERILVPVDFSACSIAALALAHSLAKRLSARIDVLHVWTTPTFVPAGVMVAPENGLHQSLLEAVERTARSEFETFVKAQRDAGLPIAEAKLEEGDPWQVISGMAEQHDYDLIVMGTHGRSGLMHVLLGSVVERVIRKSKVPVLTVRQPAP